MKRTIGKDTKNFVVDLLTVTSKKHLEHICDSNRTSLVFKQNLQTVFLARLMQLPFTGVLALFLLKYSNVLLFRAMGINIVRVRRAFPARSRPDDMRLAYK